MRTSKVISRKCFITTNNISRERKQVINTAREQHQTTFHTCSNIFRSFFNQVLVPVDVYNSEETVIDCVSCVRAWWNEMLLSSLSVLHKLSLWEPFSLQKHTFVNKSLFVELLFAIPSMKTSLSFLVVEAKKDSTFELQYIENKMNCRENSILSWVRITSYH